MPQRTAPALAAGQLDLLQQVILHDSTSQKAGKIDNMSGPVDQLDARLIGLLRDEPRIGLMEVARRLKVARGTVQARLAKLTERGVVRGFGPVLGLLGRGN